MPDHATTTASPALLLSPRDASRMLAVSARKLWAMTFEEMPGVPYVRCGRLVRYRPESLAAYLVARERGSEAR